MQKSTAGKFHVALPDHIAGRMERAAYSRATHIQVQLFSECSPADGMSAATKKMGFRHTPVGSSAIRLSQVGSRAKGDDGGLSPGRHHAGLRIDDTTSIARLAFA